MSPRTKVLCSVSCLALLGLVAAAQGGLSPTSLARLALAVAGVAALGYWVLRGRSAVRPFRSTPRLTVVQRAGLSPRSGLALIEVDGRPFLILHGDGFARIRPVPRRVRVDLPLPTPMQSAQELTQ
jgi:flagellar protein FliO/FliZ